MKKFIVKHRRRHAQRDSIDAVRNRKKETSRPDRFDTVGSGTVEDAVRPNLDLCVRVSTRICMNPG